MTSSSAEASATARRLKAKIGTGRVDTSYRLARMVARVLVSSRLCRRVKWCELAKFVAADPAVEGRLVLQAIAWLRRKAPGS